MTRNPTTAIPCRSPDVRRDRCYDDGVMLMVRGLSPRAMLLLTCLAVSFGRPDACLADDPPPTREFEIRATGRSSAARRSTSGASGAGTPCTAGPSPSGTSAPRHHGRARDQPDRRLHPGLQRRLARPRRGPQRLRPRRPAQARRRPAPRVADPRGRQAGDGRDGRPVLAAQGPGALRRGGGPAGRRGGRPVPRRAEAPERLRRPRARIRPPRADGPAPLPRARRRRRRRRS